MHIDLPVIWAAIIGFGVFLYVMLDGFDLGIGLIFPFFDREGEREVMLNTVAPVWDGNETWMVLGGACLYAVFPVAYSVLLPATYLPIIAMLCGLIFRGVAFEIRAKARRTQHLWDLAFIAGSGVATFAQGVILGSLLQGIDVRDGKFVGGPFDWFSPFNLFTGIGLLLTYATLGCGWLLMKTEGELQRRMAVLMRPLTLCLAVTVGIVSVWTLLGQPGVAARWLSMPNLLFFLPVPVLVLACVVGILVAVKRGAERLPFLLTLAIVFLGYSGLLISIFPNIIPPSLDIWAASAPRSSQVFTLVGAAIVIPIILTYTVLAYWVFRGKVRQGDEGYH
ncbi:cytochrome d ubiquinol oxidase subunit II [Luteibacter rhizovicinus DSM 16549]|uniref:Cytochrome d ubiquinol oxidase subunit II n=1 Tax=Luteibacter rhizovicinus DSM 16549 TaxID=1440763 RepID=A0A0G9HBT3_9GAMM|nr:cytochrome d ubiquinol oxidase subunit II [Luteibacter rhizovicinus]APG05795.1 cytochrome d ubiquinol oxidase subunit II [Luteibacter rhizovicinus DSM 16549]KLD67255.1 ubiquinol oxidase subunit II [Luteibacter rhizovicinus DSM 16549]KLD79975.1 ubiquinol oxidase subunit II [Xanthomonas hyacinthi DSM 19077]